jgi:hypothetical protein
VPDEAFEDLWRQKGGPELVALHSLFVGAALPADRVRSTLGLNLEQLRSVCASAERVGIVESGEERVGFLGFPADSSQRARLDWCLEEHKAAFEKIVEQLRSRLLLRYLESPPGQAGS